MTLYSMVKLALMTVTSSLILVQGLWAQCQTPPVQADFTATTLFPLGYLKSPMGMDVAKDGRVFVVERSGRVIAYEPKNPTTPIVVGDLTSSTYTYPNSKQLDVGGVWTVALSPNFLSDNWVYLFYAPKSGFNGIENHFTGKVDYRLSRFKITAGNTLDTTSEQIVLTIPSNWNTHNGASLKFGKNDNLYLSLGDNNDAGCSDQYSPMDERLGNFWCDDQRSTANTNSLNGKVLRIHPVEAMVNGLYYTIPDGNLFPVGMPKTRSEIYTMGHRNPYRIFPDPITERLYIGMNGPAAGSKSDRGPQGADLWEVTDGPANFGYPYFLKNLEPYCHWDYGTSSCKAFQGLPGTTNDPKAPVNFSPNNTGLNILPPVKPAILWESDGSQAADPVQGLGTCGPGAGPVYHYDPSMVSKIKFPPFYNDKWWIYGVGGGWQPKLVTLDPPPAPLVAVTASKVVNAHWGSLVSFSAWQMEMVYGPGDGALYILDYGGGVFTDNSNSTVKRIGYRDCSEGIIIKPRVELTTTFSGFGGHMVRPPLGAKSIVVFDLTGKKVWEKKLNPIHQEQLNLPGSEANMLWLRYR